MRRTGGTIGEMEKKKVGSLRNRNLSVLKPVSCSKSSQSLSELADEQAGVGEGGVVNKSLHEKYPRENR